MLSVLRIVVALILLEHGTAKLLAFPPSPSPSPGLLSLLGVQGLIEMLGGALMLIGLLTRPIAFILAEDMAVAYFMAQFPRACFPVMNGGDAAVLYCFVFLYIFFAGPESGNIESARMWRQVIAAIEKLRKPKAK